MLDWKAQKAGYQPRAEKPAGDSLLSVVMSACPKNGCRNWHVVLNSGGNLRHKTLNLSVSKPNHLLFFH